MVTASEGEMFVPGLLANKAAGFGSSYWHVFAGAGNDRLALGFFGWFRDATYAVLPGGRRNRVSASCNSYPLCSEPTQFAAAP